MERCLPVDTATRFGRSLARSILSDITGSSLRDGHVLQVSFPMTGVPSSDGGLDARGALGRRGLRFSDWPVPSHLLCDTHFLEWGDGVGRGSVPGGVAAVDDSWADRVALEVAAGEVRRLKSWVEGREVAIARLLAKVSSFPEKSLADAGRTGLRQAERLLRRGEIAERVPGLDESLNSG